jgi:hypothetical protein
MLATGGGVTVSVSAGLVTPPDEAVICVVPALTPVARPLLLIVATPAALLDQANVTPLMVLPLLSLAVAVNCCVAPTAIDGEAGEIAMLATVGVLELLEEPPHWVRTHDSPRRTMRKPACRRIALEEELGFMGPHSPTIKPAKSSSSLQGRTNRIGPRVDVDNVRLTGDRMRPPFGVAGPKIP